MSGSKFVAAVGGLVVLSAFAGVSRAAGERCALGTEYPVSSVESYKRPIQTGGYGDTVNPRVRGADIRIAAQPGMTAEWLDRKIEEQVAAGACQFGVANPGVEVAPDGESFIVRVTATPEPPGITRLSDPKPEEQAAHEILRRARDLAK